MKKFLAAVLLVLSLGSAQAKTWTVQGQVTIIGTGGSPAPYAYVWVVGTYTDQNGQQQQAAAYGSADATGWFELTLEIADSDLPVGHINCESWGSLGQYTWCGPGDNGLGLIDTTVDTGCTMTTTWIGLPPGGGGGGQ